MLDEKGRVWLTSAVRAGRQSRLLQGGVDASVGQAVPDRSGRAATSPSTIPKTREADAHQHLLRHASPDVCRGREQHALDERRRPGGRLVEPQDVRRDRRRGEVAGLDRAHRGYERQRQARRVYGAEPAARSGEGQAVRRRRSTRWRLRPTAPSGARYLGFPGAVVRLDPGTNPPETALAEMYEPPVDDPKTPASRRAAATWIATACTGRRWPAGTSRSFDRRKCKAPAERTEGDRPALSRRLDVLSGAAAADAGRRRRRAAPRAATTPGSTSSTRRASARTRRSTPATCPRGCSR